MFEQTGNTPTGVDPTAQLSEDALDTIAGGREKASGLATGQRQHSPIVAPPPPPPTTTGFSSTHMEGSNI